MIKKKKNIFSCAVCLEDFTKKSNLKRHILKYKHNYGKPVPSEISSLLPSDTPFILSQYSKTVSNLEFQIRLLQVGTREEFTEWLEKFITLQKCRFVCHGRRRRPSKRYSHELLYHCEYRGSVKIKKKQTKGTGCKSSIYASVKPSEPKYTTIRFHICHNHDFSTPLKTPSAEVRNFFIKLFENGLSPKQALQNFRIHIRKQIPSDSEYEKYLADREKFPTYCWVWNAHKSYLTRKNSPQPPEPVEGLKEFVENRNTELNECVCKYRRFDSQNYGIAVMTPFMRRVSESEAAGQFVFMTSLGSIEDYSLKVYLLTCQTKAGVAPLGAIVTNNHADTHIVQSLRLYLQLVDGRSFGGRGTYGPLFFMTEDSVADILAVGSVFPKSIHILSTYHVLQVLYRWLFNTAYQISEEDRYKIYVLIREMIFAETEDDIERCYHQIKQLFGVELQAVEDFNVWYEKKEKWLLYYRNNSQVTDSSFKNSIKNYNCTSQNQVLDCIKARSPTQLVDYLINEYSQFYIDKFLNHLRGHDCNVKLEESVLAEMSNYLFLRSSECSAIYVVVNQTKNSMHETNNEIGTCSCFVGVNGSSCKHQVMLSHYLQQYTPLPISKSEDDQCEIYYIATGSSNIPNGFCPPAAEVEEVIIGESIENDQYEEQTIEEITDFKEYIICQEIPDGNVNPNQEQIANVFHDFKESVNNMLTMLKNDVDYYKDGINVFRDALQQALETPSSLRDFLESHSKCIN